MKYLPVILALPHLHLLMADERRCNLRSLSLEAERELRCPGLHPDLITSLPLSASCSHALNLPPSHLLSITPRFLVCLAGKMIFRTTEIKQMAKMRTRIKSESC